MRIKRRTLIEVGVFVVMGLSIALASLFLIGRDRSFFGQSYSLIASFDDVSGLRKGAVVQLAGLNVGYVEGVRFPKDKTTKNLEVVLKISKNFREFIRHDSSATIQTQGLLGDKFILITRGSMNQPALGNGDRVQAEGAGGVTELTRKGKEMVEEISRAAKKFREVLDKLPLGAEDQQSMKKLLANLEGASGALKEILNGMNRGEGTVGALLKDPSLYHDIRALMGRANRSKLLKNLIRATIVEQEKGTEKPLEEK